MLCSIAYLQKSKLIFALRPTQIELNAFLCPQILTYLMPLFSFLCPSIFLSELTGASLVGSLALSLWVQHLCTFTLCLAGVLIMGGPLVLHCLAHVQSGCWSSRSDIILYPFWVMCTNPLGQGSSNYGYAKQYCTQAQRQETMVYKGIQFFFQGGFNVNFTPVMSFSVVES